MCYFVVLLQVLQTKYPPVVWKQRKSCVYCLNGATLAHPQLLWWMALKCHSSEYVQKTAVWDSGISASWPPMEPENKEVFNFNPQSCICCLKCTALAYQQFYGGAVSVPKRQLDSPPLYLLMPIENRTISRVGPILGTKILINIFAFTTTVITRIYKEDAMLLFCLSRLVCYLRSHFHNYVPSRTWHTVPLLDAKYC